MNRELPEKERYDSAFEFLNKIFYLIPSYEGFTIKDVIDRSDLTIHQKITADFLSGEMENILKGENCLESLSKYGNLTHQLNLHGREIKNAGGLSEYKSQKEQAANSSPITNIHHGDNYGQVVQGGHQSSFNLNIKPAETLPNNIPVPSYKQLPEKRQSRLASLMLWISNHIVQIIIGAAATVLGGFILYKLHWLS